MDPGSISEQRGAEGAPAAVVPVAGIVAVATAAALTPTLADNVDELKKQRASVRKQLKDKSKELKQQQRRKKSLLKRCDQLSEDDLLQAFRMKNQMKTERERRTASSAAKAAPVPPARASAEEEPADETSEHSG